MRLQMCRMMVVLLCCAATAGAEETTFRFRGPSTGRVYLAGDFNNWAGNSGGAPADEGALMQPGADGLWTKTVDVKGLIARYKFVIEHEGAKPQWLADPAVAHRDKDGNSVVFVAKSMRELLTAARIEVRADGARGAIVLKNPNGTIADAIEVTGGSGGPIRASGVSESAVALEWDGDGSLREFEARIRDGSRYLGGGERFNSINQRGHILRMASSDHPEEKGLATYKPVPFVMSSRGYGIWLDSTSPSTFDLNATDREHVIVRDTAKRMRLVFIAGPTPREILAEFTRLTGRPNVPPAWAFAPWKSRDVHRNRDEVLVDITLSRKHDLPASVIVLDSPWQTSYNDFRLNERQFTDPDAMFGEIRRQGFVPCFWLTPFINLTNVADMKGIDRGPALNYEEAARNGYLVRTGPAGPGQAGTPMIVPWWKGTGALVDFTNPKAVEWWHDQMRPMAKWGVAAIKCDDGESNFVTDAVFHDGSTAAEMKGRYSQLYLRAASDFLESVRPGDHTLIARCGFTGTGKYPFGWAGDNHADFSFENGLPGVIIAAQTASLSGLPMWGSDIAGYMGDATPELFIRWTQFAAFTPLMMVHMQSNKGPWDYGEEALAIFRKFARLHTRLYPYLAEHAKLASDSGMPLIRPMAFEYPDDEAAAREQFQYLLGRDLLVAPMYQSGTGRSVYLPRGTWYDYWDGTKHAGPKTVWVDAPLDRMPLFVEQSTVLPMLAPDIDTLVERGPETDPAVRALDDRLVFDVWPGEISRTFQSIGGVGGDRHGADGERSVRIGLNKVRDVEVRLRYTPAETRVHHNGGNTVRVFRDGDATVVTFPDARGEIILGWE